MSTAYVAAGCDSNNPVVIEDDEKEGMSEAPTHPPARREDAARKLKEKLNTLREENKSLSKGNLDLQTSKNALKQKVDNLEFGLKEALKNEQAAHTKQISLSNLATFRHNELQKSREKELEANTRAKEAHEAAEALRELQRIERSEVRIKIGEVQTELSDMPNLLRMLHAQLHEQMKDENEQKEAAERRATVLEQERDDAHEESKMLKKETKEYQERCEQMREQLEALQKEKNEAQEKKEVLEEKRKRLEEKSKAFEKERNEAQEKRKAAENEKKELQDQLKLCKQQIKKMQGRHSQTPAMYLNLL